MVTFDELRLEKEETFTVLPGGLASDIAWFLTGNDIPYKRLSIRDIRNRKNPKASDMYDEERMKKELQIFRDNGSKDKIPCIMITYFNKDDFISKALKIMSEPKDADLLQEEKTAYEDAMLLLKNNPDSHGIMMQKDAYSKN